MLQLAAWPEADRKNIIGVFTDIDDTLTTEGVVTGDALQALADLKAAGVVVIPITGRPVGWSEPFALQWPVDAIVAENGAMALVGDGAGQLRKIYQQDEDLRASNYARMQEVAARIMAEVPGAMLSRDSPGRETDIAIDHSEYTHLPEALIANVVQLMELEGMNATVSSIHVNGWYGDHNKLAGARWIVRELFHRELDDEIDRWVYVGDSTNDVLMFEHFPHSVGVANIRRFESQLTHPPRYITPSPRGAGFAEVAQAVVAASSLCS
ncbi:HAD-IIB family hydrolase [Caenimonas koreensis]|uniref:HAD-IIB family hydrolase n=1 Tax=Caenimonas koreensis TaxID=367474 RepID=UPI003783381A